MPRRRSGDTASPTPAGATKYPTTPTGYRQNSSGVGGYDGVYTVLDADLSTLFYSTYMGSTVPIESSLSDRGRSLDCRGNKTYISGDTESAGFLPIPPPPILGFQFMFTPTIPDPPAPIKEDGFIMRFTW